MRFLILLLILISAPAFSQTVSTINVGNPDDSIISDQDGNLYVSSFSGGSIIKYTPSGEGSLFVGGLNTPNGLAFDVNNNLNVCDFADKKILIYDIDGNFINSYTVTGSPSGIFNDATSDDLIFTNFSENSISRLSPDGTITLMNSGMPLNGPVGLAQDEEGNLFVSNFNDAKIYKILPNNDLEYIATIPSEGESPFLGFITYGKGKLWATMLETNKIYSVSPNAIDDVELFAGSIGGNNDGDISEATFNTPNGIAFSNDGNTMYVTDSGSRNLRVISDLSLATTDNHPANLSADVFPNPVSDILNIAITSNSSIDSELSIYDSMGSKVKSLNITISTQTKTTSLNVSDLKNGVYFLVLNSRGEIFTKRFIKV